MFAGFTVGADGIAFTVTVTWSVPVHPFASVPVTVYVVVDRRSKGHTIANTARPTVTAATARA
jgi:hypothetical protein